MSAEISWDKALRALFGVKLDDGDLVAWEYYLKAEKTSSAELVPAIEMAASENLKAEEWCYTVRDLCRWLKRYRAIQAQARSKADNEARLALFKSEWIEKLRRGAKRDDFIASVDHLGYGVVQRNEICREVLEAVK